MTFVTDNGATDFSGRVVGIDLGERRIGVAIGERATRTATPFTTLRRGRRVADDVAAVVNIATEQRAGEIVVGLPLNMDGTEGPQAAQTREWAQQLAATTGLPVTFRDERLTSERAERRIGGAPRGKSGGPPSPGQRDAYRARVDREAAALILQDAFDASANADSDRRPT